MSSGKDDNMETSTSRLRQPQDGTDAHCEHDEGRRREPAQSDVAGKLAEIAKRYARPRNITQPTQQAMRRREIERLFTHRYRSNGMILPDDDSGRDDAEIMCRHLNPTYIPRWLGLWAPWMSADEADELERQAHAAGPPRWSAAELGKRLGLTLAERETLRICTIRPAGVCKATLTRRRKAKKREKDRERARAKRVAEGATPHAKSLSQTEPWKDEGICRRTWFRRLAKARKVPAVGDEPGATGTLAASQPQMGGTNSSLPALKPVSLGGDEAVPPASAASVARPASKGLPTRAVDVAAAVPKGSAVAYGQADRMRPVGIEADAIMWVPPDLMIVVMDGAVSVH
jgi:hypothetical protein